MCVVSMVIGSKTVEWEAKGVTSILYEVPSGSHDHLALHSTLKAWAETYRDGTLWADEEALNGNIRIA